MWRFGPVGLAFLIACATHPAALAIDRSDLPLGDRPRAAADAGVPPDGMAESTRSVNVAVFVHVNGQRVDLRAWCRVGVWTTLQSLRPEEFVAREIWGRLGTRKPRRLGQIHDQVVGGVVARLRPEPDGSLSFRVEASTTDAGATQRAGEFFDEVVSLGAPTRHGYRFAGRAPRGWHGVVARWGNVAVSLDEGPPEPGNRVVGDAAEAEYFFERWLAKKPSWTRADGVTRADFSVARERRASGFHPDGAGWYNTYGADFALSPQPDGDAAAVHFVPGRRPEDAR